MFVVIGEAMIELSTSGARQLNWTFAGDTLNCAAAIATAAPESDVFYFTGIGDDDRSSEFVKFCASLGIDTTGAVVIPARTLGLYWISIEHGERKFTYWRDGSAARQALRSPVTLPQAGAGDTVMFSGITLAVAGPSAAALLDAIEKAKRAGALVAFDTNHRSSLWPSTSDARAATDRALSLADFVHASADDIATLWGISGSEFISKLASAGPTETLVTDGASSVLAMTHGAKHTREPIAVVPVDTTGAGDALFGTYLGHRIAGQAVADALTAAIDVASAVVQSPGALNYLLDPN